MRDYIDTAIEKLSKTRTAIIIIALILLLSLLILPLASKFYINHFILKDMGKYTGHVENVGLDYFGGSYALNDLQIIRKSTDKPEPFVEVKKLYIFLSLDALLKGDFAFSIRALDPILRFQDANDEKDKQTGEGGSWLETLNALVPTSLYNVQVDNGAVMFINTDSKPEVDIRIYKIQLHVEYPQHIDTAEQRRDAIAKIDAKLLDQGSLNSKIEFNSANYADFAFQTKLKNIHLRQLNDFGRVYANLDFNAGDGEIYSEIEGDGEQFSGYVKPMFENVDILSWKQDVEEQGDNPLQFAWEGLVGFTQTLFTNPFTDKFATEIQFKSSTKEVDVNSVAAVWGVVKNAFIEGLDTGFDENIISKD